jgi:hypothetical protein
MRDLHACRFFRVRLEWKFSPTQTLAHAQHIRIMLQSEEKFQRAEELHMFAVDSVRDKAKREVVLTNLRHERFLKR